MNRIKELRKQMGISQQKLAMLLDVHQTAISQWETGRTSPDLGLAAEMAQLFHVPLGELLGVSETHDTRQDSAAVRLPIRETADTEPEAGEFVYISEETARLGEHIAVRIRGNAMEPRMRDGDVVIVRLQEDVENGDVAVVRADGVTVCRKVKKTPTGVLLLPFHPDCEPVYYPPAGTAGGEAELPFADVGKVIELHAKF